MRDILRGEEGGEGDILQRTRYRKKDRKDIRRRAAVAMTANHW